MNSNNGNDKAFLDRLISIVEANLNNEQFGVSELAEKMRLNRSYIHRKLKSITKKSVSEFIREIRLQKAKQLLEEGSDNISEVLIMWVLVVRHTSANVFMNFMVILRVRSKKIT